MTQVPLIGLGHKAQAGKDTIADHLVAKHGFTRFAFADKLKEVLYDVNPIAAMGGERLDWLVRSFGWEEAKKQFEVRALLQNLGLAARTHLGGDVWVRPVMHQALAALEAGVPVVITDVRFPNEAQAIHDIGGTLIRVDRPARQSNAGTHVSETLLEDPDYWDHVITNGSTLEALRDLVDNLMGELWLDESSDTTQT